MTIYGRKINETLCEANCMAVNFHFKAVKILSYLLTQEVSVSLTHKMVQTETMATINHPTDE